MIIRKQMREENALCESTGYTKEKIIEKSIGIICDCLMCCFASVGCICTFRENGRQRRTS